MPSIIDDLRTLLLAGKVSTQENICQTLEKQGHPVTQSKISRMLRKVGAVKAKNEVGQIVYRLPREPAPPTLTSRLADLIMEITANETTIVVNTSPGAAQLIARILDHHKGKVGIIGTIAGDDTIFVIPASVKLIDATLAKLTALMNTTY